MGRLEKLHPATFQVLVKGIEMIRSQFHVDARSLLRCRTLRPEGVIAIVSQQANCTPIWAADADHCELWSLVDLDSKAELRSVKINRAPHVRYAEGQPL